MFERFQGDARQAVIGAQENARRLNHRFIGPEHILLGLLDQPGCLAARVLARHGLDHDRAYRAVAGLVPPPGGGLDAEALETIGIDLSAVRERVEAAFGPGALDRGSARDRRPGGRIPFSSRAKKTLELSLREALRLKHGYISDGHVLLGILREGQGVGARVITGAGIDAETLRREIAAELG
ncbi:Clp protease N-terminal domain-containing protein [Streptosporangium sandarakinum]|uniref:Clp protease N-terminal domain-containing protein n=1 Tax=Streptosporangium sandarakinum TaxID=1260955 RepID=UPI003441C559